MPRVSEKLGTIILELLKFCPSCGQEMQTAHMPNVRICIAHGMFELIEGVTFNYEDGGRVTANIQYVSYPQIDLT